MDYNGTARNPPLSVRKKAEMQSVEQAKLRCGEPSGQSASHAPRNPPDGLETSYGGQTYCRNCRNPNPITQSIANGITCQIRV